MPTLAWYMPGPQPLPVPLTPLLPRSPQQGSGGNPGFRGFAGRLRRPAKPTIQFLRPMTCERGGR